MSRDRQRQRVDYYPGIPASKALAEIAELYPEANTSELLERLCIAGIWAIKARRNMPPEPRGPRNRWR